ncbi:MAG: TRAP transporter small permease [Rhodocyclaceae bacterium]
MRQFLDFLYRFAGALAALGMVGTLLMVSAGIFSRPLGIYLRGTDDYAGYCMAACGFLALAYTFKHGEHIRVTLLLERVPAGLRRLLEWVSLAVASGVVALLGWYSLRLVLQSYEFGDVSQGVDATPLWIPQIAMAVGTAVLLIALLDDLVMTSLGRQPARLTAPGQEAARFE